MDSKTQCSIDMLATALEMEEKGRAFYKKAAVSCHNPQCKEIFSTLINDEVVHTQRIKQIHDALLGSKCWIRNWETLKASQKDLSDVFRKLAAGTREKIKADTSDLEAVDIGLEFESASIAFYKNHRSKTSDPLEAAFLDQMVLEETGHWQALQDIRYYLTDPEGWFMEKERAGLDGE
jgi:rubrerythrin